MQFMQLDKIDPKFRVLIDQLFFTDRSDLDTSDFTVMLGNKDEHYRYLWDRFIRSSEIFWEEAFWINRFDFVLTYRPRKMDEEIESRLTNKFWTTCRNYTTLQLSNEAIQFIAWAKAKSLRKENVTAIREFLLGLVHTVQAPSLPSIVQSFIPFLFKDMDEYMTCLSEKIAQSARSFEVLKQLEAQGLNVDKTKLFKLSKSLLFKKASNRPNRRSFFAMLDDSSIMAYLKSEYKSAEHQPRLLDLLRKCDYKEIEEFHLRNIKNLLELDSTIADELLTIYADKLYARGTGDKGANIKRLIRACKTYFQFSPKKVLAYLSSNSRMSDIKLLVSAFPDLKALVPFV